ncbi:hypothetical protein [Sphingomonas sp. BK580]|uniref:hypothetical protein n=1 Tax=Sphingomonas sp. BK580 TaxID=2586972 RepID=UPI00161EC3A1|nr:hypothetical protein [Sphingomonas sp. BK580]MBB3693340.1 hypothetical protein [Sphingomonas sp. BK580]
MTNPPTVFDDEELDAALLSVLGRPGAASSGAEPAAAAPRALAHALAASRRASATLGLAAAVAIGGLAFVTIERGQPRDAPRDRAARPEARPREPVSASVSVSASVAPLAPASTVADKASRLPAPRRALATADARVSPPPFRPARPDDGPRPALIALTDQMVGALEPGPVPVAAPPAPSLEPATLADTSPSSALADLTPPTRRARRDSVAAIRGFRRQW